MGTNKKNKCVFVVVCVEKKIKTEEKEDTHKKKSNKKKSLSSPLIFQTLNVSFFLFVLLEVENVNFDF